jgi:hypothetical protein
MESIEIATAMAAEVSTDAAIDPALALWLKMGRAAFFFCLWTSMAIPVALIYYARF